MIVRKQDGRVAGDTTSSRAAAELEVGANGHE
jgi:hypothetical protein